MSECSYHGATSRSYMKKSHTKWTTERKQSIKCRPFTGISSRFNFKQMEINGEFSHHCTFNMLTNILIYEQRGKRHLLMVRWVVGSILHGVDPLSYFSFQPVLHDWCNKGCGMCYPVCGMVHIKEPLLLIGKSSPCGGSGFSLSLSEWSFTICLTPYNRK